SIAAASLLGAPLMHDFCHISLSDLLTPWPVIEKRIVAAGEADWGGVSFIDNKKTKDKRKESFHKEWESTFSIIKNISDQINDYR
ncbi:hypothetical protein MJM45_31500, partial [Salmonella enterica subsp. enterica serovar Kentucky]|nr:hypothetical protein [Salmonella enterica subsp. enterica serovar Kentucky]